MARRRSKKFFQNYSTPLTIGAVFVAGVWIGLSIGTFPKVPGSVDSTRQVEPGTSAQQPFRVGNVPTAVASLPQAEPQVAAPKPQMAVFPFFPAKRAPKIAFVIDDLGYNKHYTDLLFSIHPPITIAILPQLSHSRFYATEGKKRGFETLLHLPLEPDDHGYKPGAGEIVTTMEPDEVERILQANLMSVPGVTGMNNHMGSRATRDVQLMETVLKVLKKERLFFLDSLTSMNSVAYGLARSFKIEAFKRDVFLDNVDDYEYVRKQIEEAAQVAQRSGHAVAIGHVRENTLRAVKEAIPDLEARGFQIVPLKDLS